MGFMKAERETILRWDEEDRVVSLYSASPAVWRKAARLGLKPVKETTLEGESSGKFYRFPLAEFSWRVRKPRPANPPSAAQAAARANFARTRREATRQVASALATSVQLTGDLR
jgi:hypothetical protein